MKCRIFRQIVEVGCWRIKNDWEDRWVASETYKDADIVNQYRAETKKEDVSFFRGVYWSPRLGQFCITYEFIKEEEGVD